jgi:hypothetical protein
MMIKNTATKNNFFGKHYSPAGAGGFQVLRLINGMRTTTNQKRFQDLITGMKLKSSFEFHFPLLCKDTTDIYDILRLRRDNSTIKYYCTTFVIFEFH